MYSKKNSSAHPSVTFASGRSGISVPVILHICSSILILLIGLILVILGCALCFGKGSMKHQALQQIEKQVGKEMFAKIKSKISSDEMEKMLAQLTKYLGSVGIMLLVFGTLLISVSVLGFVAFCGDLKFLLFVYAGVISLVSIACLAAVIAYATQLTNIVNSVQTKLKKTLQEKFLGQQHADGFTFFVDAIQFALQCCGIESYKDYHSAKKWNKTYIHQAGSLQLKIPVTCCKMTKGKMEPDDPSCLQKPTADNSNMERSGCFELMKDAFNAYSKFATIGLGITGGITGLLTIITLLIAFDVI